MFWLMRRFFVGLMFVLTAVQWQCSDGFNLFTLQDDISLGRQLRDEILANPQEYPVMDPNLHGSAYSYVERIRDRILASGEVKYAQEFDWEIYLLKDDATLNAFCAPGGYIFVYTGLIKFLDSEDQLAGVIGHEMAHADKRHSTSQLTKAYGLQFLLDVVLGENQGAISGIAAGLVGLEFSRSDERQADEFSVRYLCPTVYQADGASDFFALLIAQGQAGQTPSFLSTHPDPGNRVEDIRALDQSLDCQGTETFQSAYQLFKNSL